MAKPKTITDPAWLTEPYLDANPAWEADFLCDCSTPYETELIAEIARWIPPRWDFQATPLQMRLVFDAIAMLDDPESDDEQVLWSLAILANSPCPGALDALRRQAESTAPWSEVASEALGQCLGRAEESAWPN